MAFWIGLAIIGYALYEMYKGETIVFWRSPWAPQALSSTKQERVTRTSNPKRFWFLTIGEVAVGILFIVYSFGALDFLFK